MGIRSFIAIDPPTDLRSTLNDIQTRLKSTGADIRWESADKIHATIKFLGNVDEDKLSALIEAIEAALKDVHPFGLVCEALGCFPNKHRPRVIWAGCADEDGTLERMKNLFDTAFLSHGFEKEDRSFHPHFTLGRVRSQSMHAHLTQMLETITFQPHRFTCGEILLMKSVLKPQGSEYSIIRSFSLR